MRESVKIKEGLLVPVNELEALLLNVSKVFPICTYDGDDLFEHTKALDIRKEAADGEQLYILINTK